MVAERSASLIDFLRAPRVACGHLFELQPGRSGIALQAVVGLRPTEEPHARRCDLAHWYAARESTCWPNRQLVPPAPEGFVASSKMVERQSRYKLRQPSMPLAIAVKTGGGL